MEAHRLSLTFVPTQFQNRVKINKFKNKKLQKNTVQFLYLSASQDLVKYMIILEV